MPALHFSRPPWLLFLFLTVAFFLIYHDISYAKRGIDNYDFAANDLVTGVDEGSLSRQIAILSLGLYAIANFFVYRADIPLQVGGPLGWAVFSFVTWALLSPIWAEDLPLTLKRLLVFGILCVAAVAVARRLSLRETILWTFVSTSLFLVVGVVAEVIFGVFRPFASGYRFAGTLHPNGQGITCGLLLLSGIAAAESRERRQTIFLASAALGFAFLILTQSRTAIASTLFALIVFWGSRWSGLTKIAIAYALAIVLCSLLFFFGVTFLSDLENAVMPARDNTSIDSLNGRTGVWQEIGYYAERRPILGYGYGGFWTPAHMSEISDEEQWGVPDSHSTYLDYLLNLGAVGLIAYVFLLLAGIRRAFRLQRLSGNPGFAFCGAVLVFCALDGLLESAAAGPSLLMFLCMVVLARLAFVPQLEVACNAQLIRQVEANG
jgi:O-antigen ligase